MEKNDREGRRQDPLMQLVAVTPTGMHKQPISQLTAIICAYLQL